MTTNSWTVLGAAVALAAVGLVGHLLAKVRRPGGEVGEYWTRVVSLTCWAVGLPVMVSGWARCHTAFWGSAYHLHMDIVRMDRFVLALAIPLGLWAVFVLVTSVLPPRERSASNWLAGALGDMGRGWVLWCCLPLLFLLAWNFKELGGGLFAYPAAAWSTMLVMMANLIGVALSRGATLRAAGEQETAEAVAPVALPPWPESMTRKGIALTHLASWEAFTDRLPQPAPGPLTAALEAAGIDGVAPEVIEVVQPLLDLSPGSPSAGLIMAPDHSGQVEAVAVTAGLLATQQRQTTVIVTAGEAEALAADLRRFLPPAAAIEVADGHNLGELSAEVWVVSADVLSDGVLPRLNDRRRRVRIGLLVWWDVHQYSGVAAANMWAISRRMYRILAVTQAGNLPTLVTARKVSHADAQQRKFINDMVPEQIPDSNTRDIPLRRPRRTHLYLLDGHATFFEVPANQERMVDQYRHKPVVAAYASADMAWPTYLQPPALVPVPERDGILNTPLSSGAYLRDRLVADPASAGVHLCEVSAADLLSLRERIAHGGRAAPAHLPHHVAISRPMNPYMAWRLEQLAQAPQGTAQFPYSRRLVGAESNPSIVRRHLLQALIEEPDIRTNLVKTFRWHEEVIRQTLDGLENDNYLEQQEVRFLDKKKNMKPDQLYSSREDASGYSISIDSVGTDLVSVVESSDSGEDPVRMLVDRERLPIQAYPHCVFMRNGRRYVIDTWSGTPDTVTCSEEALPCQTRRIRVSNIWDLAHEGEEQRLGRTGIRRERVRLEYEELVKGVLRISHNLTTGAIDAVSSSFDDIRTSFTTQGLLLTFPRGAKPASLVALSEALRHVLPVHLGVEEEAMEVVMVRELHDVDNRPVTGIIIVELFPGGIGLVQAFKDDQELLHNVLTSTRQWLSSCGCPEDQGCARCLNSPSAAAVKTGGRLSRRAALELLEMVAGE